MPPPKTLQRAPTEAENGNGGGGDGNSGSGGGGKGGNGGSGVGRTGGVISGGVVPGGGGGVGAGAGAGGSGISKAAGKRVAPTKFLNTLYDILTSGNANIWWERETGKNLSALVCILL